MQQISHRKRDGSVHVDYMPQTLKLKAICTTVPLLAFPFSVMTFSETKGQICFIIFSFENETIKHFTSLPRVFVKRLCLFDVHFIKYHVRSQSRASKLRGLLRRVE